MFQNTPFQTSQISVTGTATKLVSTNPNRSGFQVINLGTTDIYIGENATVTTSTGHLLVGTKGASISFATTGQVYGITGGGTQSVSILETL